jgi:hypothetical protein
MILLAIGLAALYAILRFIQCDTVLVRAWCFIWGASAVGAIALETRPWWEISFSAVFILAMTLSLGLGAALGKGRSKSGLAIGNGGSPWNVELSVGSHRKICLAFLLPAYLSVHLLMNDLGQGYEVFSSFESVAAAAAAASLARYNDGFDASAITRALTSFVFLSGLVTGWYASRDGAPARWFFVLASFLPAIGWTVLLTTKANVLFWLAFTIAAFLAFRTKEARSQSTGWKLLLWAFAGVGLMGLLFAVQLSRWGVNSFEDVQRVAETFAVAALGHLFALREWFDASANWLPMTYGSRDFAGLFELLGQGQRELGIYGEQNVDVGESYTNVYSALRNLVEDIGLPLSCAAFLLVGWSSAGFERKKTAAARACLSMQLAWILWYPITSIFNYNSLIFACIFFILIALALRRPHLKRPA